MRMVMVSCLVLSLLCAGAPAWSASGAGADHRHPNVLLIMTDDQGWGDVRSHGNDQIDTPAMDSLAAEGARFDNYFVSPMCGPTRASLLTGRWNLRTGTSWVSHGKEILRLDEVTSGDIFTAAGYATGAFGKWHNGEYGPYHPNHRGFHEFFGFCRGAWENYFDAALERNGEPVKTKGYITDVLTDEVIRFIEDNRKKPFFCYVPYNAPHHPFQVPEKYYRKYIERGFKDKIAAVYGMVENIDDNLARILAKLDDLKLSENTIVIFTSDNGPAYARYNGGMRGIKASVDEGGVRAPLFIRWPGQIKPGIRVTDLSAHIDILPTIAELCEVPIPEKVRLDGRSLVPLLNGQAGLWPDRILFFHQNRLGETHSFPGGVRTGRFRLVNRKNSYELYDMQADPGQKKEVSRLYPEETQRLANAYEEWYQNVTERGVEPPPLPIGYEKGKITALQAEDAKLSGNLQFRRQQGWAHDSILNWGSDKKDSVTWNLDVMQKGLYAITLMYGCASENVGAEVAISLGDKCIRAVIRKSHDPMPKEARAQDRTTVWTSGPVPEMTWIPLEFDAVDLEKGVNNLVVKTSGLHDNSGFELKEARVVLKKGELNAFKFD